MTAAGFLAWDLDGVLFDSDEMHYLAVNEALRPYGEHISKAEHLTAFKGLPTRRKLAMLVAMGRLGMGLHPQETEEICNDVARRKQEATRRAIEEGVWPNPAVSALLLALKEAGWRQCVCSNAVRDTVFRVLLKIELLDFMDFYLSNENVMYAKPHPEIYIKAASCFGRTPEQLVVVEDAEPGRQAAIAAGCRLVAVEGPQDVGPQLILRILAAGREANHAAGSALLEVR